MIGNSYRDPWVKKAKWLTQALIVSGTLNVGLLTTFIYFALDDKTPMALFEKNNQSASDVAEGRGMEELLNKYRSLSFQELLLRLDQNDHVESGYTKRDLALSCLVRFHYFNLERALGGPSLQKREITFNQGEEKILLAIFPGLAHYQYQAIINYAKTEKWPLTSEGLFYALKSSKPPYDSSLLEAFFLTPEFHFISMLFSKTGIHIKKEHIVSLMAQGKWGLISQTSHNLKLNAAFTIEERRYFLLQLIEEESKLAAKILVETDQDYCLKQLDNSQVFFLCQLLEDRTSPSFLKELLLSPRSDEIWKKAACILYDQAGEEIPETFDLEKVKKRFIELRTIETPRVVPISKKEGKTYVVAPGDSLWKIAKQQGTTVEALLESNHLKTDRLRVGQELKLP